MNHLTSVQERSERTNFFCRERLQEESIAPLLKTSVQVEHSGVAPSLGPSGHTGVGLDNPGAGVVKTGD